HLGREAPLQIIDRGMEAARRIYEVVASARSIGQAAQQLLEAERRLRAAIARRAAAAARIDEASARPRRPHVDDLHHRSAWQYGLEDFARRAVALVVASRRNDEDQRNRRLALLK